jgi:hypothetical protein
MGRLTVLNGDVFAAELPTGEARLVYADPPYTRDDPHGYGTWPGSEKLVGRMLELGAGDAAYVLHASWQLLEELLPVLGRLAPPRARHYPGQPPYRVACWVKPWKPNGGRYPTVAWLTMWEPIVLFFGADYRHPYGLTEADWICALRSERSKNGHATQKPDELLLWLFTRLLNGADGRLAVDLFAGTGSAAIMAARMGLDAIAVERDKFFAGKIPENALAAPAEIPGWAPALTTDAHGRPVWPTLGRIELTQPYDPPEPGRALEDRRARCAVWLCDQLAGGPLATAEIRRRADREHWPWSLVQAAARERRIVRTRGRGATWTLPGLDDELHALARQRQQTPVPAAGPDEQPGREEPPALRPVEAEAADAAERSHRRARHDLIVQEHAG